MISITQFYEIRKEAYNRERNILVENSNYWCNTVLNQQLIELAKNWQNEHKVLEFRFAKSGGNPNEMQGYQMVKDGMKVGSPINLDVIAAKLITSGYQVQRHYVKFYESGKATPIPCWDLEIKID